MLPNYALPVLSVLPSDEQGPDATAQLYLRVLAMLTHNMPRWVRLHPRGALLYRLRLYHLTAETGHIWDALARSGYVEIHPPRQPQHVRLTELGIWQAAHPSPHTYHTATPKQAALLQRFYAPVLPAASYSMNTSDDALPWSAIRLCYPEQWVALSIVDAHTEGAFLLPDRLLVHGNFTTYALAQAFLQQAPSTPALLVAHTALTTLVLERKP